MNTTDIKEPLSRSPLLDGAGGVQEKHMYVTPSGKRWLGKTESIDAEFDHYVLLQAAGVRTPDIGIRTISEPDSCCFGEREILVGWLDTAQTLWSLNIDDDREPWTKEQYIECLRIAIVDYLIGNWDRHDENLLLHDGHIVAIDGGMTFRSDSTSIVEHSGMNPLTDLMWDSLTDVFSYADVMLITADVVRSIRNAIPSLINGKHQDRITNLINGVTVQVIDWYRGAARRPSFKIVEGGLS